MSGNSGDKAEEGQKKGGKGLLIGILAVVLAGGGGAGWFFLKPQKDPDAEKLALYKASPEPVFVKLDPFTVNLADEGGDRMAQLEVVLQMQNQHAESELKKVLPVVRNSVLKLASSQKADQLLSEKGKEALAESIRQRTAEAIAWEKATGGATAGHGDDKKAAAPAGSPLIVVPGPVVAVLFNQLLVQ